MRCGVCMTAIARACFYRVINFGFIFLILLLRNDQFLRLMFHDCIGGCDGTYRNDECVGVERVREKKRFS